MNITKQDLEEIIGRKLLDWEYEAVVNYIKAFRENKKFNINWARHNNKTNLLDTAVTLNAVLPEKIIFDEFTVKEEKNG